ncbi:hypothetical protein AB4K05_10485 [Kluyvera sp. STS39-E]|uniref:hypothetical protein n=1 Tax=Kluyvera sp. STS39-E TaxID=3234748 RepID=UPI0034C62920
MNKMTFAVVAALLALPIVVPKAHAISEGYRKQLEKSGCSQMTDGNGCDVHKTKAQNQAAEKRMAKYSQSLDQISSEADSVVGHRFNEANDYLRSMGWRTCGENEMCKGKWKLRMMVDKAQDYKVVNAQIMPKE